jgi:hypothetical protein
MKPAQNIRPFWRPMMWLYENLDNAKWDEWLAVSFPEWKDKFCGTAKNMMDMDAEEGHRRGLPLVLDEGGYFYPPRLSRFEISPEGLSLLEYMADLAIGHDYWGFMPGTYSGPEHLIWTEKPEWLFQINDNFQKGGQRLEDLALR